MNNHFKETILKATGATELFEIEVIQNLWSGYGKIIRMGLVGSNHSSVVIKHVRMPNQGKHPRGWNTDLSHQRKVKSYKVEMAWYKQWSFNCDESCRIPNCIALETYEDEVLMVLEDLDAAGFSMRKSSVTMKELKQCLAWLAHFHATFMREKPSGLWEVGTYWHLNTRPDELKEMDDKPLRKAANTIDTILNESPYQTFVHGDAKLANFCFSDDGNSVSAVDFQYVGGGCGMKDVAYFLGSCLHEDDCERLESNLLDYYFGVLKDALIIRNKKVEFSALESNWRELYPFAWTDFHRFLKGWSPDHWKINSYSERVAREVVENIHQKK
jgi:thiamine kinase-like enzyme